MTDVTQEPGLDAAGLEDALDAAIREWMAGRDQSADGFRRRMLAAIADADVDYEVWQNGGMVASSTSLPDAHHYAAMYSQDGPVEIIKATTIRAPLAQGESR